MIAEDLRQKYDLAIGNSSVSPFEVPRQMPAAAASLVALLCSLQRRRRAKQVAAEVGVWQGVTSRWLLTCMPHLTLHMIDPWTSGVPGTDWYDRGDRFAKRSQEQYDCFFQMACDLAEQFKPRAVLFRMPSLQAAALTPDRSLDLVFIDGEHTREAVMADARAWRPKVRSGGYLCFHDYKLQGNYFGVIPGIKEVVAELGLEIKLHIGKVGACLIP